MFTDLFYIHFFNLLFLVSELAYVKVNSQYVISTVKDVHGGAAATITVVATWQQLILKFFVAAQRGSGRNSSSFSIEPSVPK